MCKADGNPDLAINKSVCRMADNAASVLELTGDDAAAFRSSMLFLDNALSSDAKRLHAIKLLVSLLNGSNQHDSRIYVAGDNGLSLKHEYVQTPELLQSIRNATRSGAI